MATPHVAGLAVLVRQYFTDGFWPSGTAGDSPGFSPSAALMKAMLINSAAALNYDALAALLAPYNGGQPPIPLADQRAHGGFGAVNLVRGLSFSTLGPATRASGALPTLLLPGLTTAASVNAPGAALAGVDPTMSDGGLAVYCVDVLARPGAPSWLSITLVWTDPPGSPAAAYALVNDLTLEVSPPPPANASAPLPGIGAATLFGNNDPAARQQLPDTRNNVEKIYLPSPPATLVNGSRLSAPYSVRVRGSLVFQGPQAYSLVITGLGVSLAAAGSCGDDPFNPPAAPAAPDARLQAFTTATASLGAALAVTIVAAVAWHFRAALPCGGAAKAPRMGIFNRVTADDGRASLPLLPTQAGAPTFPPAGSM